MVASTAELWSSGTIVGVVVWVGHDHSCFTLVCMYVVCFPSLCQSETEVYDQIWPTTCSSTKACNLLTIGLVVLVAVLVTLLLVA